VILLGPVFRYAATSSTDHTPRPVRASFVMLGAEQSERDCRHDEELHDVRIVAKDRFHLCEEGPLLRAT
jgi:hypothetical protein